LLVIGYGNPLRSDDGIGPQVVQAFAARIGQRDDVEILALHQLTPELAEPISRAHKVVFVDASADSTPGVITYRPVTPTPAQDGSAFTHNTSPAGLLAGARDLYGSYPEGLLITIGGASFELGEMLSEPVQNALPEVLNALLVMLPA
jgi:hydrogenase maturation protease